MKPISSCTMETSQKQPLKHVNLPSKTPNSSASVIEKRWKDSEFKQSGKDLRALKQILEAMQAKGLLERERRTNSHIASLCENTNPDHSISQILSAPGLLLKVWLSKPRHRKLIFDLVNAIIVGKLGVVGDSAEPWINSGKLARKTLNAQKLLKELCTEIKQLQAKKSNSDTEEEVDGLKSILWEDVICPSESWIDFKGRISGVILDVERKSNTEAKLMDLGPLPDSSSAGDAHVGEVKTSSVEDNNPFLQPLRTNEPNRPTQTSNSTRSSLKDPTSPGWENPYMIMKPISSSRFLIEPAPWRHADGTQGSRKQPLKHVNVSSKTPNYFPWDYSEILKRLKDPELKQSGKDLSLRALKQLLLAMQAKGLLETEKEQTANLVSQGDCEPKCTNPGPNLRGQRSLQSTRINTSSEDGAAVIGAWYSGDENKALGILEDAYVAPGQEISHRCLKRILVGRSNQHEVQLHSSNASGVQPNSRSRDEFQRHSPNYYAGLQQRSATSREYYD
ncbi:hypothetical protein V6N13_060896 [Hibiscus sabdariffa]|uniref:DUF4378 domain-containing protein n=1 Tax=Hibiscus sabdariffa TaxID=183260 RepID=A0ABR2AZQ1_9ROSI